jgi:dihydrofolate reductase
MIQIRLEMIISLLVAASENNCIGKDGGLPWHLPNDLKLFRNLTWGMPVMMGRTTFESLGKPLKGRINIVLSNKKEWQPEGAFVVPGIDESIKMAQGFGCKELFVIGGGKVYAQMMTMADRIFLTRVHATVAGDTYFPEIDQEQWIQDANLDFSADEKHVYAYSFQRWKRK